VLATFFPEARERGLELWSKLGTTAALMAKRLPEKPVELDKKTEPQRASPDEEMPKDPVELRAFAIRHLQAGKAERRLSFRGGPDAPKAIKTALRHFQRAQAAFEQLLEAKEDLALRENLTEATLLIEGCVKDLPFFD
jgi:hypothetical protein